MTAITCKECSKKFEPESFGEWGSFCPYCATEVHKDSQGESYADSSENVSGNRCQKCLIDLKKVERTHTLDAKTYCHACIEDAGLGEFMNEDFRLEESVKFGLWQRLKKGVAMGFLIPAVLGVLVSVFVYLVMMAMNAGGQQGGVNGKALIDEVLTVFVTVYIGTTFIAIPFCLLSVFCRFEESVCVKNGSLIHRESSWKKSIALHRCHWTVSKSGLRHLGALPLNTPVILIANSEEKNVVCGYTEKTCQFWNGYFGLIDLPKFKQSGLVRWCKNLMLSIEIGGAIGLGIGLLFRLFTGNLHWISAWVFMGFLDGFLIHLSYKSWIRKTEAALKDYFNSMIFVIYFFAVAAVSVICFAGIDPNILIVLCSINTLLGFVLVRAIRRKVARNSLENIPKAFQTAEKSVTERIQPVEAAIEAR